MMDELASSGAMPSSKPDMSDTFHANIGFGS
jgi:hypothetical protein